MHFYHLAPSQDLAEVVLGPSSGQDHSFRRSLGSPVLRVIRDDHFSLSSYSSDQTPVATIPSRCHARHTSALDKAFKSPLLRWSGLPPERRATERGSGAEAVFLAAPALASSIEQRTKENSYNELNESHLKPRAPLKVEMVPSLATPDSESICGSEDGSSGLTSQQPLAAGSGTDSPLPERQPSGKLLQQLDAISNQASRHGQDRGSGARQRPSVGAKRPRPSSKKPAKSLSQCEQDERDSSWFASQLSRAQEFQRKISRSGSGPGRTILKNRLASLNLRIRSKLIHRKFFDSVRTKEQKLHQMIEALRETLSIAEAEAIVREIGAAWEEIDGRTSSKRKGIEITTSGLVLNGRLRSRLSEKNEKRLAAESSLAAPEDGWSSLRKQFGTPQLILRYLDDN